MKSILVILIGLIFIQADQPKLVRMTITEGVSATLPKDFVAMSENDIAQKYPSTKKPLAMFSSLDRTVDFGLNVNKSTWGANELNVLQEIYKATILDLYTNVKFTKEGIEKINGRDFIVFEFTSEADGTKKYTYLQYFMTGNRVYIFNFSTGAENQPKWQSIAKLIMNSIIIDSKKLRDTVKEEQPVHKGKKPVEVIKEQKKEGKPKK